DEAKETMTIVNRATLTGEDEEPRYWYETTQESTSYGDEAEIAKHVWDPESGTWESEIEAHMDGEGNLAEPTQYYRVQFRPHGIYNNVIIVPVVDELPDSVEFLGFVDSVTDDDPVGGNLTDGPVDIGGNLEALYDADERIVRIEQKDGTRL